MEKLHKRLLDLFAVNLLREYFDIEGKKGDEVIDEIISNQSQKEIYAFVSENLGTLHQHVHIFETLSAIRAIPSLDGLQHIGDSTFTGLGNGKNYLLTVDGSAYDTLSGPIKFSFLVPIQIFLNGNKIIIAESTVEAKRIRKDYTTSDVYNPKLAIEPIEAIRRSFKDKTKLDLIKYDINKGIKHYWTSRAFGAYKTTDKDPLYKRSIVVDEFKFIQDIDKPLFDRMISNRLNATAFKIRDMQEIKGIDRFIAEPSLGRLKFSRYTDNPEEINNLVRLILSNN